MMRLPFAFSSEQNMPAKSPITLRMIYELVQSIDARTTRLEVTTGGLVETTNRIDATLLVMKDRMSDLEQRVASIEVRLEVLIRSVEGLIHKVDILTDEYYS